MDYLFDESFERGNGQAKSHTCCLFSLSPAGRPVAVAGKRYSALKTDHSGGGCCGSFVAW
jgi:hypothetical protein